VRTGGKWSFVKDRIGHFKGHSKFLFTGGKFELGKVKMEVFSGPLENNTGSQEHPFSLSLFHFPP
jgi:hypothetical protein